MEAKSLRMGTSPIGKLIITMSLPAIFSMLVQALYNVIDGIFISNVSEAALTAVTLIFPINMLIIAISVGTGIGVNSLIARRLGQKLYEEANNVASQSYRLVFISGGIFAFLGFFFSRNFAEMFTTNQYVIDNATIYCQIVTVFSIFIMMQINNDRILQAQGNMIVPMVTNLIGATTHIILAYFLVFGHGIFPQLGVAGAAISTVTGEGVGVALGTFYIFGREHLIKIKIRGFKIDFKIIKNIYSVGFPAIVMQSLASIMLLALNGILIGYSDAAVAVLGVYFRTQAFIFMPVFGLTQGIMPIIGYNYGAKNKERLMRAYKISLLMAISIMTFGILVFQLLPVKIFDLFSATPEMYSIGVYAFRVISIGFILAAYGIICSVFFQGMGHGMYSLLVSLARQLVGIIPLAFIFSSMFGLYGIWWAFPASELIGTIASSIVLYIIYVKEIKSLDEESIIIRS
ncbi:MAG: MATE family efflux transporter [Peptostreptococcaceae bacterium]|nr:MATE family efflux transporter [Peptostreptococcaceae bacterium]